MNTTTRRLMPATLILATLCAGVLLVSGQAATQKPAQTPMVVTLPTVMVIAKREALMAEMTPVVELPTVVVTGSRAAFNEMRLAQQTRDLAQVPG